MIRHTVMKRNPAAKPTQSAIKSFNSYVLYLSCPCMISVAYAVTAPTIDRMISNAMSLKKLVFFMLMLRNDSGINGRNINA